MACVVAGTAGCGHSDAAATADAAAETAVADAREDHGLPDVPPPEPWDGPRTLAETGLYADPTKRTLATDVLAYSVKFELWADGARKDRYVRIPKGAVIDVSDPDRWVFPVGTQVWKDFWVGERHLETRYVERRAKGYRWVSFVWDASGTTAIATPEGATNVLGTGHDVPTIELCGNCHRGLDDEAVLGIGTVQISGTKSASDLVALGALAAEPPKVDPPGTALDRQVLGYFHGNCGHCHNGYGLWSLVVPLRLRLRTVETTVETSSAWLTTRGMKTKHVMPGGVDIAIVPGDPDHSQLYLRMGLRDDYSMPPLGTKVVDTVAHAAVRAWILGMK